MSVTILIPYYNRYKFKELIEYNINIQDYEDIKEVIVLDDSDDGTDLKLDTKYNTKIIKVRRMTIGEKRNELIKKCNTKYAIFMDSDDIYLPSYVSHSMDLLLKNKKYNIVGSADMLFYFTDTKTYSSMSCLKLHLIHEATICVNAKWFKKCCKFNKTNSGEGQALKGYEKFIIESDIKKLMVCIGHKQNTVNKNQWNKKNDNNQVLRDYLAPKIHNHLNIISTINL